MNTFFFLSLLLSSSLALAQGHVTGTGGDGFYFPSTKKLYLRDLYEAGITDFTLPKEGRKDVEDVVRMSVNFLPISKKEVGEIRPKLVQKILQINEVVPGFGSALLHAMKMHTYVFVDVPLSEIPDEDGIDPDSDGIFFEVPSGAEFRQIANRSSTTIRIHRPSWHELSDEHRIALLFHEAIYSLQNTRPSPSGYLYQSALKTREITGHLFSADFDFRGASTLPRIAKNFMNLPWDEMSRWEQKRQMWELFITPPGKQPLTIILPKYQNFPMLLEVVQSSCNKGMLWQAEHPEGGVEIRNLVDRLPYQGEFYTYQTKFGPHQGLQIWSRTGDLIFGSSFTLNGMTEAQCVRELRKTLNEVVTEI